MFRRLTLLIKLRQALHQLTAPQTAIHEVCSCSQLRLPTNNTLNFGSNVPSRSYKTWQRAYLQELYNRQLKQGPSKQRRRSEWINWNYDAELYAFGQRLGESFNENTLRTAFTQRSYVEEENARREKLGISTETQLAHNQDLAERGTKCFISYLSDFIKSSYPKFPVEGVQAVTDFMFSSEVLDRVASNLGIQDIVLSAEHPVPASELTRTLMAVVGALEQDQGTERTWLFVRDLVGSQLIGRDLNELWSLHNPMGLLSEILRGQGQEEPEARLLRQSGQNTVLASYAVGLYTDKQLIAQGLGESCEIAEDMAARNALRQLFETGDACRPLRFS